jgi:hypothetical protein
MTMPALAMEGGRGCINLGKISSMPVALFSISEQWGRDVGCNHHIYLKYLRKTEWMVERCLVNS